MDGPAGVDEVAAAGARVGSTAAAAVRAMAGPAADVDAEELLGDLLVAVVALARAGRVDPEQALRRASRRFRDRLAAAEDAALVDGTSAGPLPAARWRELWVAQERPRGAAVT